MSLRSSPRLNAISIVWSVLLAGMATAPPGWAQTPAQDAAAGPALRLTPSQRQTIFLSVSRTQKNNAAPTGFRASVGARVPPGIDLEPVSRTVATLVPQARRYEIAMVEKQVMLVDPATRQVVAVVTGQSE